MSVRFNRTVSFIAGIARGELEIWKLTQPLSNNTLRVRRIDYRIFLVGAVVLTLKEQMAATT